MMGRLILILILTISFQTLIKADDITDFQIEGISIGDKLLDHFSIDEIKLSIDESEEDRVYIIKTFLNLNIDLYDSLQIAYKNSDQNKVIVGIVGAREYPDNINSCKKEMYKIVSKVENLFPNSYKKDWGKYKMPTNQGHYFPITFDLKDLSRAMVSCQDFKKSSGISDNLKVSLFSSEYSIHLQAQN